MIFNNNKQPCSAVVKYLEEMFIFTRFLHTSQSSGLRNSHSHNIGESTRLRGAYNTGQSHSSTFFVLRAESVVSNAGAL